MDVRNGREAPRLVVGLTGGAGAAYGVRLLQVLRDADVETHLVMCHCSGRWITAETGLDLEDVRRLAHRVYDQSNQAARISSGSFLTRGMVVAPCSAKSLAAIANGLASNLIHRAADVTIKEGRKLVLLVRDATLSPIQMENVERLAEVPAVVVPRDEGSAASSSSVDSTVAALLDQFGLAHAP